MKSLRIIDLFERKAVWTRPELSEALGIPDRHVRALIRIERRNGLPIMALPEGGYKIAETDAEKRTLFNMYLSRASDEFATARALQKSLNIPGQIEVGTR